MKLFWQNIIINNIYIVQIYYNRSYRTSISQHGEDAYLDNHPLQPTASEQTEKAEFLNERISCTFLEILTAPNDDISSKFPKGELENIKYDMLENINNKIILLKKTHRG